jgi:hypothetical protein
MSSRHPSAASRAGLPGTASAAYFRHLARLFVPIGRVKNRSQYEIALVHLRFELDTEAMIVKSVVSTENCFAQVKTPDRGSTWSVGEDYAAIQGDRTFF